uniref:uncharacterized protein LOC132686649 n=1 Tax=Panthera onca TaxID=9690 RepID=UPI0029536D90|nr:uncharacterized protein LOC132686649 [Panthera onca]
MSSSPALAQLGRPRVAPSPRIGDNGHCIFTLTWVAESRGASVAYSRMPLGPRTAVSRGGSVLGVSLRPRGQCRGLTARSRTVTAAPSPSQRRPCVQGQGSWEGTRSGRQCSDPEANQSWLLGLRDLTANDCVSSLQIRSPRLQGPGPSGAWMTLPICQRHQGFHPAGLWWGGAEGSHLNFDLSALPCLTRPESPQSSNSSFRAQRSCGNLISLPVPGWRRVGPAVSPWWAPCDRPERTCGTVGPPLGRVAGVGDHSQHHLDFWGRRQLSLIGQEPVSQSSGSVPTGPLCAGNPLL